MTTRGRGTTGPGGSRPRGATRGPVAPRPASRPAGRPGGLGDRPVTPARPGLLARLVHGQTSQRTVRGLLLASVLAFLAVLLFPTIPAWVKQRDRIDALQVQVATQEAQVKDLTAQLARWKDPAYVEQQARERLKFVRPGEKAYTVLDGNPQVSEQVGPDIAAPTPGTPSAWYATLWSSLAAADSGADPRGPLP